MPRVAPGASICWLDIIGCLAKFNRRLADERLGRRRSLLARRILEEDRVHLDSLKSLGRPVELQAGNHALPGIARAQIKHIGLDIGAERRRKLNFSRALKLRRVIFPGDPERAAGALGAKTNYHLVVSGRIDRRPVGRLRAMGRIRALGEYRGGIGVALEDAVGRATGAPSFKLPLTAVKLPFPRA